MFCSRRPARYKPPRQVEFRTLPKGAIGKILRHGLAWGEREKR